MSDRKWRDMFEQRPEARSTAPSLGVGGAATSLPRGGPDDDELPLDGPDYKPWVLQRGRPPALLLHLRRHEPKSGMWMGWAPSYHTLIAADYLGDRMVSLDFGMRQFMIEGEGLGELVRHLQRAAVLTLHEYSSAVWPTRPEGALVSSIRRLGAPEAPPQG